MEQQHFTPMSVQHCSPTIGNIIRQENTASPRLDMPPYFPGKASVRKQGHELEHPSNSQPLRHLLRLPPMQNRVLKITETITAIEGGLVCSQIPILSIAPTNSPIFAIVEQAVTLEQVARLHYLYTQALIFAQSSGPYSLGEHDCTVYASMPEPDFLKERFMYSLAVAQDYLTITDSTEPISENLETLRMLGETTISILEQLLDLGELAVEPLSWGILALSSGYISSDPLFSSHKERLCTAIESFTRRGFVIKTPSGCILKRSAAIRQVHCCATMLLQIMRRDWSRLRWYHGVQVAKRWIDHLGIIEL
jgi:hypothetical protein